MPLKEKIQRLAQAHFNEIVEIRRLIHQNPELAYEEYETAALICQKLDAYHITYQKNIARTGVVGILKGRNPDKKCIALRADMDALPIQEENQVEYRSRHEGKMHACGHDVHTAILLGAAGILSELSHEWEGTLKLIFQPSEERMPSGAAAMIAEGVMEQPKPQLMLGVHVSPEIEVGKMGFRSGPFMASSDEIYITVIGKGGHAARPEDVINPLYAASKILLSFENITDLQRPLLLSFGKITAQGATNIIPDKVEIAGTLRCFDETLRSRMKQLIETTSQQVAAENRCQAVVRIVSGYPVLINNQEVTEQVKLLTAQYIGADNVIELPYRLGSEDFAFFAQQVPACFFRVGVGNRAKGIISGIHTATFDVDERSMEIAAGNMAWVVMGLLAD